MYLALSVDNKLVQINNEDTIALQPEPGYTYTFSTDLSFEAGDHQAYLLYMASDNREVGATNSRKMFIHVTEE